jgi:two-component system chemotaxis response regulator CheB
MKIRILIVDDSVIVRRLLDHTLSVDPTLTVVGAVPNGRFALKKLQLEPIDLVILDVEMPEMDGMETLVEIRKHYPKLPVIMFSQRTERGAKVTIDALFYGANDYVTKPVAESKEAAIQQIQKKLIPKIKALCPHDDLSERHIVPPHQVSSVLPTQGAQKVSIVVIGVSTGGPKALAVLIPDFSRFFSVPIVIVQHMPPFFTKQLAKSLAIQSAIPVSEAVAGDVRAIALY